MKIVFAGGGTAGHINPALAIAKYIKLQKPDSEILFVGTKKGMESILVPKEGFDMSFIEVYGLKRKLCVSNIKTFFTMWKSLAQAGAILDSFKPDFVVGTGGYVSAPVVFSAALRRIPSLIHEQNAFPGLSNKILKLFARTVAISFEESRAYFKGAKNIILTGNPVRDEFLSENYISARRKLGIPENSIFILAFGGSLGAEKFNEVFIDFMIKSGGEFKCTLAAGDRFYSNAVRYFSLRGGDLKNGSTDIRRYIDDMPVLMNAADLVVCRAGAITVAELLAAGKASVLIPSPNVANNHQEYNARAAEAAGAAKVITENSLDSDELYRVVLDITQDRGKLEDMCANAKRNYIGGSAEKITENILSIFT